MRMVESHCKLKPSAGAKSGAKEAGQSAPGFRSPRLGGRCSNLKDPFGGERPIGSSEVHGESQDTAVSDSSHIQFEHSPLR
jgi:hypothetical protein